MKPGGRSGERRARLTWRGLGVIALACGVGVALLDGAMGVGPTLIGLTTFVCAGLGLAFLAIDVRAGAPRRATRGQGMRGGRVFAIALLSSVVVPLLAIVVPALVHVAAAGGTRGPAAVYCPFGPGAPYCASYDCSAPTRHR